MFFLLDCFSTNGTHPTRIKTKKLKNMVRLESFDPNHSSSLQGLRASELMRHVSILLGLISRAYWWDNKKGEQTFKSSACSHWIDLRFTSNSELLAQLTEACEKTWSESKRIKKNYTLILYHWKDQLKYIHNPIEKCRKYIPQ